MRIPSIAVASGKFSEIRGASHNNRIKQCHSVRGPWKKGGNSHWLATVYRNEAFARFRGFIDDIMHQIRQGFQREATKTCLIWCITLSINGLLYPATTTMPSLLTPKAWHNSYTGALSKDLQTMATFEGQLAPNTVKWFKMQSCKLQLSNIQVYMYMYKYTCTCKCMHVHMQ